MTKEDILHHFQDINFYYNDCMMYDDLSRMLDELIAENKGDLIRQAEDYENEIADLHNRLDIAEYDKERYKEEITILEAENKGEWKMPIQDDGMSDPIYYQVRCSKCGFDLDPQTWHQELHQYGADNFCPNCGADMRGEADDK